jgi:phosphatidylglycerol:prolipoprotein diacylglycerol transferase
MIAGFMGARLLYVLYQEPQFYVNNPIEIFSVWKGGFIYYGGFISGLLFGLLFLKLRKQNLWQWLDVSAPVAALSYGLGRLACFFNGCCYGAVTEFFGGLKFPHLHGLRHPTQIYAVVYELCVWFLLLALEKKVNWFKMNKGLLFLTWIFLHGLGRILMEIFRADPRGDLVFGLSVSTAISGLLIVISTLIFIYRLIKK